MCLACATTLAKSNQPGPIDHAAWAWPRILMTDSTIRVCALHRQWPCRIPWFWLIVSRHAWNLWPPSPLPRLEGVDLVLKMFAWFGAEGLQCWLSFQLLHLQDCCGMVSSLFHPLVHRGKTANIGRLPRKKVSIAADMTTTPKPTGKVVASTPLVDKMQLLQTCRKV